MSAEMAKGTNYWSLYQHRYSKRFMTNCLAEPPPGSAAVSPNAS
jgi:hypothetical protein